MHAAIRNGLLVAVSGAFALLAVSHLGPAPTQGFVTQPPALAVASATGEGSLFTDSSPLAPGRSAVRSVTVGKSGQVGIFLTNFNSRSAASAPTCTAPDPADRINFTIITDSGPVYQGTLNDFASQHASAATALQLGNTGSQKIVFEAGLDSSAGNAYMGCRSTADFNWSGMTWARA
jgi:hypothetical protein